MKKTFAVRMLKTVWLKFGLALQKGKTYQAECKQGGGYSVHWSNAVMVGFHSNKKDFEIV